MSHAARRLDRPMAGSEAEQPRQVLEAAKIVSATVGIDFFNSLVAHLASSLGGDCVYIAQLVDSPDPKIRTIAVFLDGAPGPPFEQDLSGSAGGQTLSEGILACSKQARRLFPDDPVLARFEADAYVGVRLTDSAGQVIGLTGLIGRKPLRNVPVIRSVLDAFRCRIAAELERMRTEDALRKSEQRYRAFISTSADAMWRVEFARPIPLSAPEDEQIDAIFRDGYIAECNDALAHLLEVKSAESLIGQRITEIIPSTDEWFREQVRLGVRSRYRSATIFATPRGADGKLRYRLRSHVAIIENDHLLRLWGTTRDITELKEAELAVEASERRFRQVLESIELPALILGWNGEVLFCNDALQHASGSSESVIGKNWLELISEPRERETWAALLSRESAEKQAQMHFEGLLRRGGPGTRVVVWDAIALPDGSSDHAALAAIGNDVTEKRRLELRVAQSEKFESIGRLAGGVAHDVNNLLTVIIGHVSSMLDQLEPASPFLPKLLAVQAAANDCGLLTEQLLAIGQRQRLEPVLMNLNELIGAQEAAIRRLLGPDITLVKDLNPRIGRIWADPVQVRRILINLAKNSRDAMGNGGTFNIATANVEMGSAESAVDLPPGEYVRLTVTDTGSGLTEEVRRHMFDPFFTTKPHGQGTGLGLSTVHGIVLQSGGHISARCEPGEGATIEILFPAASGIS